MNIKDSKVVIFFITCIIGGSLLNSEKSYFICSFRSTEPSGDLLLWAGVRHPALSIVRRASFVNIFFSRTTEPIRRVKRQKIVILMTPLPWGDIFGVFKSYVFL